MSHRSELQTERTEAHAAGGMVAAKTPQAAEAAAEVLARGGNAVDAAVVCAFVSGVAEPWMNGIGGGGYLVRHDSRTGESSVVEYPMVSPAAATPDMFPLTGAGSDTGLFGWPLVKESANIVGHRAVCVPGTVDGLALALTEYGTLSLSEALQPAITLAEQGQAVTWHTSHMISKDLHNLTRFPATREIFCPGGQTPWTLVEDAPEVMRQPQLAQTLRQIADDGSRTFYEGPLAHAIVSELRDNGAPLTDDDFASYRATIALPLETAYAEHVIATTGGGTGGTTLSESMRLLSGFDLASFDHNAPEALHLMAQAFRIAFSDRFAYLADPSKVEVPLDALLSADYLAERRNDIRSDTIGAVTPGTRERLAVRHSLAHSMADYTSGGSTTHLSVIDRDGVAVSLTQTLLSGWGSRVTVPGTGILLNNGMMWFDPEPGRPNSVAGGKRPLSNMAPAILTRHGQAVAAIGASGGRRIMNCVAQLAVNLIDHGMTMQAAVGAPRIDHSTPQLFASKRITPATVDALRQRGHQVAVKDETLLLFEFASPACVQRRDSELIGGVDPYYYPATAVGVD